MKLGNADNLVVVKHGEGYNIFLAANDTVLVGVSVKSAGENLEVNGVRTVFKREIKDTDEIVYPVGKVVSPEQSALLDRKKLSISASGDTKGSIPQLIKKSSAHTRLVIRKSIADYVQRRWGYPALFKANPYHDARGRFARGKGVVDIGSRIKDPHGCKHEIQRKVETQGGNFVFIAYQKHTHEEDDNLAACKILADEEGWNCVLLPATSSSKSPDMINANDGRFWEIKTNRRGTISSLDNELRAAKDQSKNVIVRFDMNYIGSLNRNDMESAGKRRIKREGLESLVFIIDGENKNARIVWV